MKVNRCPLCRENLIAPTIKKDFEDADLSSRGRIRLLDMSGLLSMAPPHEGYNETESDASETDYDEHIDNFSLDGTYYAPDDGDVSDEDEKYMEWWN
jgi:hypothetical protein